MLYKQKEAHVKVYSTKRKFCQVPGKELMEQIIRHREESTTIIFLKGSCIEVFK